MKVEITITEQRAGAPAQKKSVNVIVADGMGGSIRSLSSAFGVPGGGVPLNIDASPMLLPNGKIRLRINLNYNLVNMYEGREPPRGTVMQTDLSETLNLVLDDGKPLIASQSADPSGDRQVTVEVKATVMK